MNTTQPNDLPDRLSEKAFRRYEKWITLATELFPKSLVIGVHECPVKPTTFVARLRDAMVSFRTYNWPPNPSLDRNKFDRFYDKIRVVRYQHETRTIEIGGDKTVNSTPPVVDIVPLADSVSTIVLKLTTLEQKLLVAELASNQLLKQDLHIDGLTADEVVFLENNFDVSITNNVDGTHKLQ